MAVESAETEPPRDPEEMQRMLEEQMRQIRVQDLLLESAASIINLSARRIAKPDERDLEQGRIGIEAVRAIVDLLEPAARDQVREALTQVQMLYAREVKGSDAEEESDAAQPAPRGAEEPPPASDPKRSSGLWTPPGVS